LQDHGDSFELRIPLAGVKLGRSALNGNTLIATGYRNEVIELDPAGNEVWKYSAPGAWSAEKLDNGNVLIASYQLNKVLEVSPAKEIAWEFELPGVLSARPLDNGNILASSHSGNRVVEVNRDKVVVWTYTSNTQCHDAIRLENGNTLVCTNDNVVEVDSAGDVVWSFPAEQAYGIDTLDNGNLLVAKLNGAVIEVDRQSNAILWTYNFPSPVDVFRTEEGTTLITGSQSAVEINDRKETVWSRDQLQFGSVRK
jgi:outer membrane protein assembly factor BamB